MEKIKTGDDLRQARKALRLTQQQLSRIIGHTTSNALNRMENNRGAIQPYIEPLIFCMHIYPGLIDRLLERYKDD